MKGVKRLVTKNVVGGVTIHNAIAQVKWSNVLQTINFCLKGMEKAFDIHESVPNVGQT